MSELDRNPYDRLASTGKITIGVVLGQIPIVGPIVSEVLKGMIPDFRLERIVAFLKTLEDELTLLDERLTNFEKNVKTGPGSELFYEGAFQASQAVSDERKERLARLLARSMSAENLEYERSRKLLNLYKELTDPEIVWLIYYSLKPVIGRGPQTKWIELHPDILKNISQESGLPREHYERAALQDSWKATLLSLGLTYRQNRLTHLTTLGRLLVRFITDSDNNL